MKSDKPNSRDNTRNLSYYVWKRFKQNSLAVVGLFIVSVAVVVAILGYLIMPDSTPMANEMSLQLTSKKPGFTVKTLWVRKNQEIETPNLFKKMLFGEENKFRVIPITSWRFEGYDVIAEEYSGLVNRSSSQDSLRFNLAQMVSSLSINDPNIRNAGDSIFFNDFYGKEIRRSVQDLRSEVIENNIRDKKFLLGTDRFGRDLLSRLMAGTRVSLSVGLISVFISLVIGLTLGALSGYFRGNIDNAIMWLINVIWSIPTLLLVIAITLALGKGFWQVFVAVGLTMWVEVARVVRGQFFGIREMEFVEAGRALGYKNARIIIRHIFPNIMGPIIVISAANFASAILLEAGLSFLGVGAQPPMPSWGVMIKENYGYIIVDAAYLAILPGLAIMLMVLAFNMVGNGLRDALDAKGTISGRF